jgi:CheY-like chemotaxis protein
VKIIAASGLSANSASADMVNEGAQAFLLKPYTAETLLEKIAGVLARA